ncbi:MAG TPA: acyl-CoA dehydrogenase family protein [Polyangiaceae bacterium]
MLLDDLAQGLPAFAARAASRPDTYPAEDVDVLRRLGAFGAPFPRALGGRDSSLVEMTRAVEAIAAEAPSTALLAAMPMGLAGVLATPADALPSEHRMAWRNQVDRIASEYREGKLFAACNSEKGAGGSLAATRTVARPDADGAIVLDGEKILASFGANADVFFSTAKVAVEGAPEEARVEFFLVDARAPGVRIASDWNGFGMRGTESHTVHYTGAAVRERLGCPGFIERVRPLQYWFCLFAAIPLGCAAAVLRTLGEPAPSSPALRLRLSDALMRYESLRAYLHETAAAWRPAADAAYAARVLRTKTYVTQEATRLAAEMFALGGGRHYVRGGRLAGALADAFAGTALRPPLPLALDQLIEGFTLGDL